MNKDWEEYRELDKLPVLDYIFYPRRDYLNLPDTDEIQNYLIPVADNISISSVFFPGSAGNANLLYFHGNGEIASEYIDIAGLFHRAGVNLFAVDYRGYGRSGGQPSIVGMLADAHQIFRSFTRIMDERGFRGSSFVMGRSLGSISAIELSINYPEEMRGVIIESGFCEIDSLIDRLGISSGRERNEAARISGKSRVAKMTQPLLIIHGENDELIPLAEAKKIYQYSGSKSKKLVVIPGGDHNSLLEVGLEIYLSELTDFISAAQHNNDL